MAILRNTDDRDVIRFLKFFTEIDLDKIEILKNKNINQLKFLLANKTTQMLHVKKSQLMQKNLLKKHFQTIQVDQTYHHLKFKNQL